VLKPGENKDSPDLRHFPIILFGVGHLIIRITTKLNKENDPMQIFELNCRLTCRLVLLLIICLFLGACGSSDVSDVERDFSVSMTVTDAGETTRDIDVIGNPDCDGDVTTVDPETFTNVSADITIFVSDTGLAIRVESYTVAFLPHRSDDGSGNLVTPPSLNSYPDAMSNSDWIDTGTSSTITGITVMTFDTKDEYLSKWAGVQEVGLYTIRVTLSIVDKAGKRSTLVVNEQVNLSFYDNC
jgi:hypothetical protein